MNVMFYNIEFECNVPEVCYKGIGIDFKTRLEKYDVNFQKTPSVNVGIGVNP